jgi:valyl-tRNA synthetase
MALGKHWEPTEHEKDIYRAWEESGAFVANRDSDKPAFTISLPPPNATGTLHTGHSIMLAIEDAMIRWRRMAGDEALWVPGTDHAAIATESVVIQQHQKAGMKDPRGELGREELVRRIAAFVEESRSTIRGQMRAMGASIDWSRERFTMDPALNRCVNEVFAKMFADGLIYRGPRIVNWDPHLQTTVSDDEIYHETRRAKFYTLRYGPFLVGTSRPETKLGDTAVAVHPDDERYQEHIGKTYEVQWPKGPTITVRVVADTNVDPEFGTGCLGVTPAHSAIDFEIAEKNDLPLIQIIGEDGCMTDAAGPHYAGMTVHECRTAFAAELEAAGLLHEVKDYDQQLSLCYRSKKAVEPLPKEQWFIDVNKPAVDWKGQQLSLKEVMRDAVASGGITILPEHEQRKYYHWIENLRDWCISRQIWWGHRVPVWTKEGEEPFVGHGTPMDAGRGDGWTQDPDTLDTWFSSALWTWSTLIDQELTQDTSLSLEDLLEQSPDFQRFHPTSVMETGYDILFFWVARMILMTTYATGQIPFRTVYLHGLVLDRDGDKMSKSKPETSVDPLETIATYGADALRLALLQGNAPGKDLRLSEERLTGCKRLINKLWNATKLCLMTLGDERPDGVPDTPAHPLNAWMLTRLDELIDTSDRRLEGWHLGDAAEMVRASFWGEFCDTYLEAIKVPELAESAETKQVIHRALRTYLALFHPYMPFVTEHLWGEIGNDGALIRAAWPTSGGRTADAVLGADAVVRAIGAARRVRAEQEIDPHSKVALIVRARAHADAFESCRSVIDRLVKTESITIEAAESELPADAAVAVDSEFDVAVQMGAADRAAARARLEKQLAKTEAQLASVEKRLANENFVTRAKPEAVERARSDAASYQTTIAAISERLAAL